MPVTFMWLGSENYREDLLESCGASAERVKRFEQAAVMFISIAS
jgi:hypothetical protein